jgi:hypothetical protein
MRTPYRFVGRGRVAAAARPWPRPPVPRLRLRLLLEVQVAAQSYAWFAGFVGSAVRRRDRPPCGEQFLDGERCLVIDSGDFHDRESRLGHVPVVDRLHTRHDAQAPAGVRASGQRHPTGYGETRVLTIRRELHERGAAAFSGTTIAPTRAAHSTKTRQRPLRGR